MASTTYTLYKQGLIHPPSFMQGNVQYEAISGSHAYGVNDPDKSDYDVIGFCIPPKEIIFPHLAGTLCGFDHPQNRFEQFEATHIQYNKKEYDLKIYNIVKFFRLGADCNPQIIESLFVPANYIIHTTRIGNMVRENRKLFLSKKIYHTMKGYAYSMMSAMQNKKFENSNRKSDVEKYGYSLKYAYHVVRLLNQTSYILTHGDLDLQFNKEQLKSIRRGEWTLDDIKGCFNSKEKYLEELYQESNVIPMLIQEDAIKSLLLNCLEEHYGSLAQAIVFEDKNLYVLKKIKELVSGVI